MRIDQFMNIAANPSKSTSVTNAEPLLKSKPASAGKIAKTRGVECQLLSSSCFCFLSFFVEDGFRKSSANEPVASSRLEYDRMLDRRRGSSEGVERRLLLLDWRFGKRCLKGLEEDEGALYALPVVVGGGRTGMSDLASAIVVRQEMHGSRRAVVGGDGDDGAMEVEGEFYVETGGHTTDVCLAAWWLPEQGNARGPTPANTPGTAAAVGS